VNDGYVRLNLDGENSTALDRYVRCNQVRELICQYGYDRYVRWGMKGTYYWRFSWNSLSPEDGSVVTRLPRRLISRLWPLLTGQPHQKTHQLIESNKSMPLPSTCLLSARLCVPSVGRWPPSLSNCWGSGPPVHSCVCVLSQVPASRGRGVHPVWGH